MGNCNIDNCYTVKYLVPTSTSNWARYVGRIRSQVLTGVNQYKSLKVLPNRLTPVYSKNYFKEENYLKVKTVIFKYITPPYSNSSVHWYIALVKYITFLYIKFPTHTKLSYITQLPLIL